MMLQNAKEQKKYNRKKYYLHEDQKHEDFVLLSYINKKFKCNNIIGAESANNFSKKSLFST